MAEAGGSVPQDLVDNVMTKIEDFYFGDGEVNGEQLFYNFAKDKHTIFEDNCDAELTENKVE